MKIAICLDERNGMMFAGRRQSMDRIMRQEFLRDIGDAKLWMNTYSASMFSEAADRICVDEDFLQKAAPDDWCFVENVDVTEFADRIGCIMVFRWNVLYPADMRFPENIFCKRWKLIHQREFSGSSHEKITQEVYVL